MHGDQVPIDIAVARALICDRFPRLEGHQVVELKTAGTVNAIFRIGTGYAARFPLRKLDPDLCRAGLERDAAAMAEFRRFSAVPSPEPLGIGVPGRGYPMPWSLQSWVEGDAATPDGLANADAFARDLAQLVRSLRCADVRGRQFSGSGRGGVLADHDDWVEHCFARSAGLVDVPGLRRVWRRLRAAPQASEVVMSHKDLIPGNLLVRNGRLAGVIDTGDFGPADPALDLVAAWHMLDRTRRAVFRRAVGAGEQEWARGAGWALQQAVGLVWYYRTTNPPMSALGLSTAARVMDELG